MLAWLSVWNEVQTCMWPSWCHGHSLSLASVKSRLVLPFWCRLTWVVPEIGPLSGCVCVCVCVENLPVKQCWKWFTICFAHEWCAVYLTHPVCLCVCVCVSVKERHLFYLYISLQTRECAVPFFSRPRSEGWPHRGRTFSIYLCPPSFWLTLSRWFLSASWCCPSRPCVAFLACVHLALILALSLSPGNTNVLKCNETM